MVEDTEEILAMVGNDPRVLAAMPDAQFLKLQKEVERKRREKLLAPGAPLYDAAVQTNDPRSRAALFQLGDARVAGISA